MSQKLKKQNECEKIRKKTKLYFFRKNCKFFRAF